MRNFLRSLYILIYRVSLYENVVTHTWLLWQHLRMKIGENDILLNVSVKEAQ